MWSWAIGFWGDPEALLQQLLRQPPFPLQLVCSAAGHPLCLEIKGPRVRAVCFKRGLDSCGFRIHRVNRPNLPLLCGDLAGKGEAGELRIHP